MPDNNTPVAIITGAGSGVGRALALQLSQAGYACALAGRTLASLQQTEAFIVKATPEAQVKCVATDVGDSAAVQNLIDETASAFGRIDAAANVAGYAPLQPINAIDDATLARCLAINFSSVVYTTRACWPIFTRQKRGVIVNVSSMASLDPFTGFNIYGAAKAAVNLYTKATADEGRELGIKAYAIAPGAIETPMLRSLFDEAMLPKDKTLPPEAVAEAIAQCITGKTTMQSGETFVLDSP